MPMDLRLGKLPARKDTRIPRMSRHGAVLPPPPASANWYAEVEDWGMLGNDQVGDCVEAAVMHAVLMMTSYAQAPDKPPMPTTAEALSFYEQATGYNPADPNTDQGSYVLGDGGVMDFWFKNGIMCGGILNKPTAFLQITRPHTVEWKQAISIFGNLLIGLNVPESLMEADTVPMLWSDPTGPSAGGHEILLVGYQSTRMGTLYDLISWGQHYRATENFLLSVYDEAVTVVDPAFMNVKGLTPSGLTADAMGADMAMLRAAG